MSKKNIEMIFQSVVG